jgi:hypothetical protein
MDSSVINLGSVHLLERRVTTLGAIVIIAAMILSPKLSVYAQDTEYERFVHTYINSETAGNLTYMEKPGFPVLLRDFQVSVGENWSIVAPLVSNHSYHVYCYGKWIDNSSTPITDYEIYVYNSLGEMEGYHTPSAGLPAHLGTTVDDAFFAPKYTGNYTFVTRNDPRESKGAQQATFMIIEDVESNVWHQHYVEGKDSNDLPVLNTSWGYEFATESQHVEVYLHVPKTLDMYEARLYLMYDPTSPNRSILNGVPLAWEPGLYGNRSTTNNVVGGYNLESKEYRGVAYASCEFYGQDMFLNFTSPFPGKNLYHLVFIGEVGFGTIDFLVKTEFNNANLRPSIVPGTVYPDNNVTIAYVSNSSALKNATLQYSADSWKTANSTEMEISNLTCKAVIPGQIAGTSVSYVVTAHDLLENTLVVNGSFSVKYDSTINLTQIPTEARPGENITVAGSFSPGVEGIPITVYLSSDNESKKTVCYTTGNGTFTAEVTPDTVGAWVVYAGFNGSSSIREGESTIVTIQVDEPMLSKYSYYIFGAVGAVIAIGMGLFVRKSRA